jgi:CrcB protein
VTLLLVALGGALGASVRYLVDRTVQARHDSVFPWGTFVVNVAGSLLLGLVAGLSGATYSLLGTGFCGALTTYSTFSYETLRLLEEGSRFYALTNVVATVLAGLGAMFLGLALSG